MWETIPNSDPEQVVKIPSMVCYKSSNSNDNSNRSRSSSKHYFTQKVQIDVAEQLGWDEEFQPCAAAKIGLLTIARDEILAHISKVVNQKTATNFTLKALTNEQSRS